MIREVIAILKADAELMGLLGADETQSRIYPIETDYLGECVIYDCVPISDDRITQAARLQITIITDTLAKAMEVERVVKRALLTLADETLTNNILTVEVNGGGSLYDGARRKNHRILYFNILSRSE